MASRELLVSIAVLAGIGRSSPALACDPAVAQAQSQAAWQALDELRAADFFQLADGLVTCPDLSPQARAELLRLQGASAALQKDTERAVRLFGEARALDPSGQLPEREFPPTHPVSKLYRLSTPRIAVSEAGAPLPAPILVVTAPTALPPAPEPQHRRVPLIVGAGLSSLAAGGLWAASLWMDGQAEASAADSFGRPTEALYAEQERLRGRQLGLQVAAGGSAALAVGLVGATVSLSW